MLVLLLLNIATTQKRFTLSSSSLSSLLYSYSSSSSSYYPRRFCNSYSTKILLSSSSKKIANNNNNHRRIDVVIGSGGYSSRSTTIICRRRHRHHPPLRSWFFRSLLTTTIAAACESSSFLLFSQQYPVLRAVVAAASFSSSSSSSWFGSSGEEEKTTRRRRMEPPYITERSGNDGTIIISPRNEQEQSGLIIISHGLGDSAEGFVDVAQSLAKRVPYMKFILPTAPTQPVTMNMGMSMPSWYDITGLDERSNENCHGITDSKQRIENLLLQEHEQTGLPYDRMILMGFSQGGALSLYTGLQLSITTTESESSSTSSATTTTTSEEQKESSSQQQQQQQEQNNSTTTTTNNNQRLAGIICLSGYLPAASTFTIPNDIIKQTPVLHCHGTDDPVVPYPLAIKSRDVITSSKHGVMNYQLQSFHIAHTVSQDELDIVLQFIQQHIPDSLQHKIQLKDPTTMSIKELKAAIRRAGIQQQATGFMEKSEFVTLLQKHRNTK